MSQDTFFVGIDPGLTTGLGIWSPSGWIKAIQCADLEILCRAVEDLYENAWHTPKLYCTVEMYAGGGYRTKESTETTEVVGFFRNWIEIFVPHEELRVTTSNTRLSGLPRAMELYPEVQAEGPHRQDGLAHAIVHARKKGFTV